MSTPKARKNEKTELLVLPIVKVQRKNLLFSYFNVVIHL